MKICQVCRANYEDDQMFCFQDGSLLVARDSELSESTVTLPQDRIPNFAAVPTAEQRTATIPNAPNVRKNKSSNVLLVVGLIAAFVVFPLFAAAFGLIYLGLRRVDQPENRNSQPPIQTGKSPKTVLPVKREPKLKVEIQDKVKGSFGRKYLRCMVTNVGEGVIENPRISLLLYKNDLKVGTVWGDSKLEMLKPNQTIPIWIDVTNSDYTSAEFENSPFARVSEKDEKNLYPILTYTDVKLTSTTLTSSYNFRDYPEVFYKVKGIVLNSDYEKINVKIYVFFYDENKQIIGIGSSNPPELKKGEKAEFEVEIGETSMFGKPFRFEISTIAR